MNKITSDFSRITADNVIIINRTANKLASGRLIAPNLVLTAKHISTESEESELEVIFSKISTHHKRSQNQTYPSKVVWKCDFQDIALVKVDTSHNFKPLVGSKFAVISELPPLCDVYAIGMPAATWDENQIPIEYAIRGTIQITDEHGPYSLTIDQATAPTKKELWKGISGTVVFFITNDQLYILGVIEESPAHFNPSHLKVSHLKIAQNDSKFISYYYNETGTRPTFISLSGTNLSKDEENCKVLYPNEATTGASMNRCCNRSALESFDAMTSVYKYSEINKTTERILETMVHRSFIGGHSYEDHLKMKWLDRNHGIYRGIGITGYGGIGKTTTAAYMVDKAEMEGWRIIWVCLHEIGFSKAIPTLQDKLNEIDGIQHQSNRGTVKNYELALNDIITRLNHARLSGHKIAVVLDNADSFLELESLVKCISDSKTPLLITSRVKHADDLIDYHELDNFDSTTVQNYCTLLLGDNLITEMGGANSALLKEFFIFCSDNLRGNPLAIKLLITSYIQTNKIERINFTKYARKSFNSFRSGKTTEAPYLSIPSWAMLHTLEMIESQDAEILLYCIVPIMSQSADEKHIKKFLAATLRIIQDNIDVYCINSAFNMSAQKRHIHNCPDIFEIPITFLKRTYKPSSPLLLQRSQIKFSTYCMTLLPDNQDTHTEKYKNAIETLINSARTQTFWDDRLKEQTANNFMDAYINNNHILLDILSKEFEIHSTQNDMTNTHINHSTFKTVFINILHWCFGLHLERVISSKITTEDDSLPEEIATLEAINILTNLGYWISSPGSDNISLIPEWWNHLISMSSNDNAIRHALITLHNYSLIQIKITDLSYTVCSMQPLMRDAIFHHINESDSSQTFADIGFTSLSPTERTLRKSQLQILTESDEIPPANILEDLLDWHGITNSPEFLREVVEYCTSDKAYTWLYQGPNADWNRLELLLAKALALVLQTEKLMESNLRYHTQGMLAELRSRLGRLNWEGDMLDTINNLSHEFASSKLWWTSYLLNNEPYAFDISRLLNLALSALYDDKIYTKDNLATASNLIGYISSHNSLTTHSLLSNFTPNHLDISTNILLQCASFLRIHILNNNINPLPHHIILLFEHISNTAPTWLHTSNTRKSWICLTSLWTIEMLLQDIKIYFETTEYSTDWCKLKTSYYLKRGLSENFLTKDCGEQHINYKLANGEWLAASDSIRTTLEMFNGTTYDDLIYKNKLQLISTLLSIIKFKNDPHSSFGLLHKSTQNLLKHYYDGASNLHSCNNSGWELLTEAAFTSDSDMVKQLIKSASEFFKTQGGTPLSAQHVMDYLLQMPFDTNRHIPLESPTLNQAGKDRSLCPWLFESCLPNTITWNSQEMQLIPGGIWWLPDIGEIWHYPFYISLHPNATNADEAHDLPTLTEWKLFLFFRLGFTPLDAETYSEAFNCIIHRYKSILHDRFPDHQILQNNAPQIEILLQTEAIKRASQTNWLINCQDLYNWIQDDENSELYLKIADTHIFAASEKQYLFTKISHNANDAQRITQALDELTSDLSEYDLFDIKSFLLSRLSMLFYEPNASKETTPRTIALQHSETRAYIRQNEHILCDVMLGLLKPSDTSSPKDVTLCHSVLHIDNIETYKSVLTSI